MKGLVFSEPMVKAWMEGRKTVTRRLIKKQPVSGFDETFLHTSLVGSFYRPGETVYIKETWGIGEFSDPHPIDILNNTAPVRYKCGYERDGGEIVRWRSPRFMPEWAARSHALIKSVRPERIQEITEEEAVREGIERETAHGQDLGWKNYLWHGHFGSYGTGNKKSDAWYHQYSTYKDGNAIGSFSSLWELINGPGSWERNDWVWRIKLEKKS